MIASGVSLGKGHIYPFCPQMAKGELRLETQASVCPVDRVGQGFHGGRCAFLQVARTRPARVFLNPAPASCLRQTGAVPKGPLAYSIELEASEWPISERRELRKPLSM